MPKDKNYEIYLFTNTLILEAGDLIRKRILEDINIDTKSNEHDFVTNIDKEVEQFLVQSIRSKYHDHEIVSEEGFGNKEITNTNGYVWGIDPIDGTSNLVYKKKDFAISIGIYCNGIGIIGFIYDVQSNTLYSVIKDEGIYINGRKIGKRPHRLLKDSSFYCRYEYIYENKYKVRELIKDSRHLGYMTCASLGFVELALGNIDVMIGKGNMKFWDIAAGKIFADEAGVSFYSITQKRPYKLLEETDIIACDYELYREIERKYF